MKLKKPLVFTLSLCVALGAGMTAVACGETNEENATYTVNIDVDEASALADMKVLFYSDDTSKSVALTGTSVSVELPEGDYTVYLTGKLPGYTYTPATLTKAKKTTDLYVTEVEAVEENGEIKLPYQFLVLYPGGEKIFKGGDDNGMQICTSADQEGATYMCYDFFFDNNHIARLTGNNEQFYLPAFRYDIHFPETDWPEGYTFDEEAYSTSNAGGFYSVEMKKA